MLNTSCTYPRRSNESETVRYHVLGKTNLAFPIDGWERSDGHGLSLSLSQLTTDHLDLGFGKK